mgnify:CR=1 FL=1
MQKLMISKAIMDKHNEMPRGNNGSSIPSSVSVENFDAPQAKYNIPQSMISEQTPEVGVVNTKPVGDVSIDAIKKSKLPDAIKKLMLENPIQSAQQQNVTLSDELVEKASKLMGTKKNKVESRESQVPATLDMNHISMLVKEAVNEALKENGLLIESVENSNDIFSFKVGSHIFEGKITKVKKVK